jgi:hypothetical protein
MQLTWEGKPTSARDMKPKRSVQELRGETDIQNELRGEPHDRKQSMKIS